jgi:hypothetical protein
MCAKEEKAGQVIESDGLLRGCCFIYGGQRKPLYFKLSSKRSEKSIQGTIWEKIIPGRGNSRCKVLEI